MRRSLLLAALTCCVPAGNSTPSDAGTSPSTNANTTATTRPSPGAMTTVFEDNFDRVPTAPPHELASQSAIATIQISDARSDAPHLHDANAPDVAVDDGLGPNWRQAQTNVWHIENGRLCGKNARNHGVWLNRILPINARIEFDAITDSAEGDIKAEVWGDGQSSAKGISYTDATSYLTILGGWKNKYHVLARINEHANDRKQIDIDPTSDDPREKPAIRGQIYHFKIERTDSRIVRWSVDGLEYLTYDDPAPLTGVGHDHFGFNDWEVKLCFDNVKVTPL